METLKFGRWRGTRLDKVPRSYLMWLVRQENIRPDLRVALKRRLGMPVAAPAVPVAADFKAAAAGDRA
jgi:hypothetical protein